MMRFLLALMIWTFAFGANAQNLVINGGFEDIPSCSVQPSFLDSIEGWDNLYDFGSGADVFNSCSSHEWYTVPGSLYGYQDPLNGDGYGGFIAHGINESPLCRFKSSLEKDSTYRIRFGINLTDISILAYSQIGVIFWDSVVALPNSQFVNLTPDYEIPGYVDEKDNWQIVDFLHISDGGEVAMSIGLYGSIDSTTYTETTTGTFNWSYYLIDDFSVRKANPNDINDDKYNQLELGLYPNPAHGQLSITAHEPIRSLRVLDLSGRQILSIEPSGQQTALQISIADLPNGVYLLTALTYDGAFIPQKFVKAPDRQ